ncbi:MAG TPA: F0F1 ATP synthase subunit delta [Rhodospirillales bacterium]|nr:F0F1 ATP synthase subunit delta [Rhodospirillales bacterium]MDP7424619.1 F0F1 ATP synthase subunit delta [Rhodospirillales bacterium]HJO85521.1 F0F1 ATP synthase subunit delta [Rhodospirillales bacterium]
MSSETTDAQTDVTGLSGRYATALFELAEGADALDQVADDLRQISTMMDESDDLIRMVRSPVIPRADQSAAMQALLEKTEASQLTRNFIGVVASNRRLFALADIIDDYLMVLAGRRGEMTAEVTSAKALTESQKADIEAALQSSVGGKVSINSTVDPDLLGGLVVKIGSRMVDSSLHTKLQHLKLAMRGVG